MNTSKSITLTIAAICALGASALADQQPNQKAAFSREQARQNGKSTQTWDKQPMPLRAIGYPVVILERTGHSILRTPTIASETFHGKRTIVSKNGLLTEREMKKNPKQKVASAPSQSVANNRG